MTKLMQYKGYYGSIDASPEDACLYGKLEFIAPLVSYEAETVPALVEAFHAAVDDFLATCEQQGQTPDTPCKGSFNVRVGHELHMQAVIAAREAGVSLNDFARRAIERQISLRPSARLVPERNASAGQA